MRRCRTIGTIRNGILEPHVPIVAFERFGRQIWQIAISKGTEIRHHGTMKEDEIRQHVRLVANHLGIRVEDIPESHREKRPDFEFFCDDECSLVELKSREKEWNLSAEEISHSQSGGIVERSSRLSEHPTISGTIDDAVRQLATYQSARHSFRIVWYCAYGVFRHVVDEQIDSTFLGDVTIHEGNFLRSWRAYFFNYNKFFKHRQFLDAAVVSQFSPEHASAQLVVNPLSERYDALRASRLYNRFSAGILDPLLEEKKGEGVILGGDADRSSERTKLQYLANRYKIENPFILPMGHYAVMAGVPKPSA